MKIKIHPASIIISVLLVWKFGITSFISTTIAVFLHELCHAFVARERGYVNNEIILMPYGAILYNRKNFDKISNIIIALSGPIFNLLLALIITSFLYIIPTSYPYLISFIHANVIIGLFNILPLYPLDGGRVILAFFKYKPKTQKILKFATIISSICLVVFYIISTTESANYTLLVISLFLFLSVFSNDDENNYSYFLQNSCIIKDFSNGVIERVIYVDKNASIRRIFSMLKPQYQCVFIILDGGKEIAKLSENDIKNSVANFKLDSPISQIIPQNNHIL